MYSSMDASGRYYMKWHKSYMGRKEHRHQHLPNEKKKTNPSNVIIVGTVGKSLNVVTLLFGIYTSAAS